MYLDNILLLSIIVAWPWLQSREKAINATGAPMNGSRERVQRESQESARHVKVPTGIRLVSTSSKRDNALLIDLSNEPSVPEHHLTALHSDLSLALKRSSSFCAPYLSIETRP